MLSFAALSITGKVRRRVRRHGLNAALCVYGMRAVNLALTCKILRALYLTHPNPAFSALPAGYAAGFASREELHRFAQQPGSDLTPRFVDQSLAHGDQCFALRHGRSIAAYSWYSFRPTPIGLPGVLLFFDPHWVYRYKDYTHPEYRGRRLHAIGTALGLAHYRSRGFLGAIAYVESTNFESLKSCCRAGHQSYCLSPFGTP